MKAPAGAPAVKLLAAGCRTPFGDATATHAALLARRIALELRPVGDFPGADRVPLALLPGRALAETSPPAWLGPLRALANEIPGGGWGGPRTPVFVTSSNFGVGSLYAFTRTRDRDFLRACTPAAAVEQVRRELGWDENVSVLSHACVSAQLGLLAAARAVAAGGAERALVFSFDFLSPFVAGGFHALKILNDGFPAPYADRATGSIGLGDGAAFAVVTADAGDFVLQGQSLYNELQHFTANRPDGDGFAQCLAPLVGLAGPGRLWIKGHGTGTIEAGRLEAETLQRLFPGAPLVSWKGSLGHTLGSCLLVELAVVLRAMATGQVPGTVATAPPAFAPNVAAAAFPAGRADTVLLTANAFGGAHAACLLSHA